MNMIQIEKMCKNIYADYVGMGRKKNENDEVVLSLIMRQYAQTEIDWEEVKFLWVRFLEKGTLDFSEANKMAEMHCA
jgi:hypothetical protein